MVKVFVVKEIRDKPYLPKLLPPLPAGPEELTTRRLNNLRRRTSPQAQKVNDDILNGVSDQDEGIALGNSLEFAHNTMSPTPDVEGNSTLNESLLDSSSMNLDSGDNVRFIPQGPAYQQLKLLIINPNSSNEMTQGMKNIIEKMYSEAGPPSNLKIHMFTGPADCPASIDNEDDARSSSVKCFEKLTERIPSEQAAIYDEYDAFLVACYSVHPLVDLLRNHIKKQSHDKHVTGIFEASITVAMSMLPISSAAKFGIVTTGQAWEPVLTDGVQNFFGGNSSRFAAVVSTGLNAGELHNAPDTAERLEAAVVKLLRGDPLVDVICLGCAGMAGMDDIVRRGAKKVSRDQIKIVDGVKAGVTVLVSLMTMYPTTE